jgi:hypothetical protein
MKVVILTNADATHLDLESYSPILTASGQLLASAPVVLIKDRFGQIVALDRADPVVPASTVAANVSLGGATVAPVLQGYAVFAGMTLSAIPGSPLVQLQFSTPALIAAPLASITVAPCTSGQYPIGVQCLKCAAGTVSRNGTGCPPCPPGSYSSSSGLSSCAIQLHVALMEKEDDPHVFEGGKGGEFVSDQ